MFRILALDGGGIKGAFTVSVLEHFEERLGKGSVLDYFDLIVGTSTGGIIALGLASGLTCEKIRTLYVKEGGAIFPQASRGFMGMLDWIFGTKFDGNDLKRVLEDYFPKNERFAELKHRLAITSFEAANARPVVFKTPYHASLTAHSRLSVVDVALATSAAPTYFAAHDIDSGVMLDGGVWANCPAMVGVTEALSLFSCSISDIHMLNIGTTSIPTFVSSEAANGGILRWARKAPSLLMHAAQLGAISQAKKLCNNFVRVDEMTVPRLSPMDNADNVDLFVQLGQSAGRNAWEDVKDSFFGEPV